MTQPHSADILPFPQRKPAATGFGERQAPLLEDPQARLQAALAALDAALEKQRVAVSDWRGAMGALQGSVAGLGESLTTYQTAMGALGEKVATLHDEAVKLEATADAALRQG